MSWPRLKNIMILMLLAVNLLLAGMALYYWQREAGSRRMAMENAAAVLEAQGITLRAEVDEMSLPVMEVQRDQRREEVLAADLLGEVRREDRGAGVYRYVSSRGTLQFHSNGEFSASFPHGTFPLDGMTAEEHALDILKRLDFRGEVTETREEGGELTITVRQELDGVPLLSCQAVLVYDGDCLTAISQGRRLNGVPGAVDTEEEPISAAGALIRFLNGVEKLGDVCNTITQAEQSYRLSSALSGPTRLTPMWYFTTDIGRYQMDALTGELTRSDMSPREVP